MLTHKRFIGFLIFCLCLVTGFTATNETALKGIVFFQTKQLPVLKGFYVDQVGCEVWLDQGGCMIFKAGNMLFGFCQREKAETQGMITFFVETKKEVDDFYQKFKKIALSPPKENPKYQIYHFFAKDPEGRYVEFQKFLTTLRKVQW